VSGWPWTYVCVGQELMSVLAKNKYVFVLAMCADC
jgi:hypothetical protein